MKKISMVSLVALLAATPMMAEAARVEKVGASAPTADEIAAKNIATTSYVKGAYKAAADKIDAVIEDTRVAAKAEGEGDYTAINVNSSVGENLAALDSAIANASSAAATNVTTKINELTATVSQTTGDINISVTEQSGVLTGVSASINDGAVTTGQIANGTILVEDVATSALATTIADSTTATDSKLATEKAVRTVVDSINNAASGLTGRVTAAESDIDALEAAVDLLNSTAATESSVDLKIKTKAASADYTNASMDSSITTISGAIDNLDTRLDTAEGNIGTLMGNGEGSVAKAEADAKAYAKTYADSAYLTVYTTWDTESSATVDIANSYVAQ